MRVATLRLWNVRNHASSEFRPAPTTTVVTGPNGAGKSTLLEAVGLFATLSSPRTGQLSTLVLEGADEGGVHLEPDAGVPLEVRFRPGRTSLRAGGSGTQARNFLGRFRSVLFTPEDLDLVRGEPELRRRALDDLLTQLKPAYRGARQDLERALRQRNAALRAGQEREAALYGGPLAAAAAAVIEARRDATERLEPVVVKRYGELAGRGGMGLRYRESTEAGDRQGADLVSYLEEMYADYLARDLERARTSRGPHRDDLELEVDGRPARGYASRGEQRCVALAFRLAELELLPGAVLLLDDVLSELDPDRRERVFAVTGDRQTIVTATEPDVVPSTVGTGSHWTVREGVLREDG